MKNFGKCAKKEAPRCERENLFKKGRELPAQLESELELPRVVGRRGLTGEACSSARYRFAELVDRRDVGAIEKVEAIRDEIELQAFAEGNLLGHTEINLEEAGTNERVAPQASITTCGRSEKGHHKG